MRMLLEVELDNAAFENYRELPRILRALAKTIEQAPATVGDTHRVMDVNGNTVGNARVVK